MLYLYGVLKVVSNTILQEADFMKVNEILKMLT